MRNVKNVQRQFRPTMQIVHHANFNSAHGHAERVVKAFLESLRLVKITFHMKDPMKLIGAIDTFHCHIYNFKNNLRT